MKITLETIRQVLQETLGFESFTAGFITKVIADQACPTACITREGVLRYGPDFVAQNVKSREDLFCLVFHELLHPMFGHFIFRGGQIENIAADGIINSVISTLYTQQSDGGHLFRTVYAPCGLNGLLRPESRMQNSRYLRVYKRLYATGLYSGDSMTTGELIQTLKILSEDEKLHDIALVGSHGTGPLSEGVNTLPHETTARIAEDLRCSAQKQAAKTSGYSLNLVDILMEALRTHLSMRRVLLQRFTTKRKVDRFKEHCRVQRASVSPIPLAPSKRDLVLLSAGVYPFHFHNRLQQPHTKNQGLAVYLDVSGSVNKYLPKIVGILGNLRHEIESVFLFSNRVSETSMSDLLQGRIKTTFGTDFDCIADSILERGFDKAVVITDGFAFMQPEKSEALQERNLQTLTVLFDKAQCCEAFEPFGDVLLLEDVCE